MWSSGRGPNKPRNANKNPMLHIKLKPMMVQMRIPSSVKSQVLHANKNILPPIVDKALQRIGDPVTKIAR